MSEIHDEFHVPKGALLGAAALLAVTILFATVARLSGEGATRLTLAPVVQSRALFFSDTPEGGVAVFDARDRSPVAVLPAGNHGFVRVVLHGLAQDRAVSGLGADMPFHLNRLQDGSAVLEDPATGRVVTLNAFGSSNLEAFTQLLDKPQLPDKQSVQP